MVEMGMISLVSMLVFWGTVLTVEADDPYKNFTWNVTYGWALPLGIPQQVIWINGAFPGPPIECETNDNIAVNVFNKLNESFLITWNGIKQRKNCWQDGVLGTNCPILPNTNWTYHFQAKDQIGSFTYFPSTEMHRAVGGFGVFNVIERSVIKVPYATPAKEFSLLIGDWYKKTHQELKQILYSKDPLPFPDAILINGALASNFTGDPGKTYMFRVSNIGLHTHFNFHVQHHKIKLVEVEGCHVKQIFVDSLDVYVGQSVAFLVTLDHPRNASYYIVASSTFMSRTIHGTALLRYTNRTADPVGPITPGPDGNINWSMEQARSIRWDRTANAARPNPQGSYNYSAINISRTITLENSAPRIEGLQNYAINKIVYINPKTPLKLADYLPNITGVFNPTFPQNVPSNATKYKYGAYVLEVSLHEFVEIVFQNNEEILQTFHLDGYDFWIVGMGIGQWSANCTHSYNLVDAPTRHTAQVYAKAWTAIHVKLDNLGMWNLRSAIWPRQYLGQQLYVKVNDSVQALTTEYRIPPTAILCGAAVGRNISMDDFLV